jgi:hypothetical protein
MTCLAVIITIAPLSFGLAGDIIYTCGHSVSRFASYFNRSKRFLSLWKDCIFLTIAGTSRRSQSPRSFTHNSKLVLVFVTVLSWRRFQNKRLRHRDRFQRSVSAYVPRPIFWQRRRTSGRPPWKCRINAHFSDTLQGWQVIPG